PPIVPFFSLGVGVFCCQDCGAGFSDEAAFLEHRHLHPQQNTYLNKQSDAEKDNEAPYFCTFCSHSFADINELRSHMKNHNQTSLKESDFVNNPGLTKQHTCVCPDCGKSYAVIGHFLNHLRSHRSPSASVFNDLEHLKKKSFQCESCGRNYSRASALDAHRRCHEEKLVKSKSRSSGDTGETGGEIKRNDNTKNASEKQFECLCGKAFSAKSRLKTHQRFSRNSQCTLEEDKEKPKKISSEFYCAECNKAFSNQRALSSHQRWHHNPTNTPTESFQCEECGKVFKTLMFYNRHQRMAHSDETPAKSFLHQVCQVQKKAFECKDCGLKFSRASALQSHQLQHTVFRNTEQVALIQEREVGALTQETKLGDLTQEKELGALTRETEPGGLTQFLLHQDKMNKGCWKKSEPSCASLEGKAQPEKIPATCKVDESHTIETDEDLESYEPGDFNVQVVSDSESEDEASLEDPNPDLELLCESDQDIRDDADSELSPGSLVSKSNFKIVQVDFDQTNGQCTLMESGAKSQTAELKFNCPDCYRWFTNPSSLRIHRMWHGIRKRRQQHQAKKSNITCKDCGLKFTHSDSYLTHLHQHALEEEEAQLEDSWTPAADQETREDRDEDMSSGADEDDASSSSQTQPPEVTQDATAASTQNMPQKGYSCLVCGKVYSYLESYKKHQNLHKETFLTKANQTKPQKESASRWSESASSLRKYECPDCGMSFIRRTRLISHLRGHRSRKCIQSSPLKCDQCNKSFLNVSSWTSHTELHKLRRFWCLSCARGFLDEASLDRHLQSHSLKQNVHNTDDKSSQKAKEVTSQPNFSFRTYPCRFCGKTFLQSVKDETEMNANAKELQTREVTEGGDPENSEESDCGEPMHCLKFPKHPNDPTQPPVEQDLGKNELNVHREHKYWEWECIECDMGFDEMEKLHLHYIKHATGEVPIPQHNPEG
ncbi:zinc finger protein 43, partial [Nematolebias whitei]|uniref:zinc finger protein 43 n=1 Tax=Nematolebias whitei TaxID=451745 RepID=UPI00189BD3DC